MGSEIIARELRVAGYAISVAGLEFALAFGNRIVLVTGAYLLAAALGVHLYLQAETPPSRVAYRNALLGFFSGTALSWFAGFGFQLWLYGLPIDLAAVRTVPVVFWHAIGVGMFFVAGQFALGFSMYVWNRTVR